jgi:hypothetical protein
MATPLCQCDEKTTTRYFSREPAQKQELPICIPGYDECKTILIQAEPGRKGESGPDGIVGTSVGIPQYYVITPTDNTTVTPIDLSKDVVAIDTSNFSPILSLGQPSQPKYIELKLLNQRGLPAEIQLSSGGSFDLSASDPNVLLFWDGTRWNVLDNPAGVSSFLPNAAKPVIKLMPGDALGNPELGEDNQDVSISDDGNTIAFGGLTDNFGIGAAWVFVRSPTTGIYSQQGPKIVGSGIVGLAEFGASVSLSADGNTLAVGGPNDNNQIGATWIFVRNSNSTIGGGPIWTQQGPKLVANDFVALAAQGSSVALSADGNTLVTGGPGDSGQVGATWVYMRSGGVWFQVGPKLVGTGSVGPAFQGSAVAISADGTTIAICGPFDNSNTGATWIFTFFNGVWSQQGPKLVGSGATPTGGTRLYPSLSSDGNTLAVASQAFQAGFGAVWVFTRGNSVTGVTWTQQAGPLQPVQPASDPFIGPPGITSVVLSGDGNALAMAGFSDKNFAGGIWVFRRINGMWTQFNYRLTAPGSFFLGNNIDMTSDGNILVASSSSSPGFIAVFQ